MLKIALLSFNPYLSFKDPSSGIELQPEPHPAASMLGVLISNEKGRKYKPLRRDVSQVSFNCYLIVEERLCY